MRRAILVLLVLVGCGGVAPANVPSAGSIWFGSSFDPQTFALDGRAETIPFGQPVALVAGLSRKTTDEALGLHLDIGGTPATWPGGQMKAGNDVYGQVLPAAQVFQPGRLTVSVIDVGGNVLATGSVTISP